MSEEIFSLPKILFNPNNRFEMYNSDQEWFNNPITQFIHNYLWSLSDLFAPQEMLSRINPFWVKYYEKALSNINNKNILIIGTGFGILPLLALSENRTIFACERYPLASRVSQGIIQKYSLQNNADTSSIKSICMNPLEMKFPNDIPYKCDLLIYDDFDYTLLETGFIKILDYLKKEILTPDAQIIPLNATIYAMAIELVIDNTYFNLNELDKYLWNIGPKPFDINKQKHIKLSEPEEILFLDFNKIIGSEQKDITLKIINSGKWNAIIYWNDLFGGNNYCIQYIDPINVFKDSTEQITVHQQKTKIRFQTRQEISIIRDRLLPSWHIDMVNDDVRNKCYYTSIRKIINKGNIKSVLDIGTGTGLLSMMAAKADSDIKIYSCEIFKNICETAKNIIKQNGLDKQIAVINKDCLKLHLPEKVDLVICEIFDCGLIGEGVLHFLKYARNNLMKYNGRILPMSATVKAMLIEYRTLDINDINLSLTNAYRYTLDYNSIDLSTIKYKQLSDPFEVFSFNFLKSDTRPEEKELIIPIINDGIISATVFWFDLNLDEDITITTSPFSNDSLHWKQALQYVQEIIVNKNMNIPLIVKHNGSKIEFHINREKLDPNIKLIQTPRYDPYWVQHYYELDKNYQQMILRIVANPESYKMLVDVSAKLASEPGSFNIRSKFANRLAESFYIR